MTHSPAIPVFSIPVCGAWNAPFTAPTEDRQPQGFFLRPLVVRAPGPHSRMTGQVTHSSPGGLP